MCKIGLNIFRLGRFARYRTKRVFQDGGDPDTDKTPPI